MKTLISFNKIQVGIDNLCISKLSAQMCDQDGDSVSMEMREEMTAFFTRPSGKFGEVDRRCGQRRDGAVDSQHEKAGSVLTQVNPFEGWE
jgi:hypothetical protein